MPLSVAGAFHTEHMAPAVGHLAELARSVSTHDPRTPWISNRDGQVVQDGREVMRRIVGQIASPVRSDLCLETMADLGVTGILEMPPAGTLTGIAKRALQGVETFALKTPDQLDDARAFCVKHGAAIADGRLADLADGRLPRQGHVPPRRGRQPRLACSSPAPRLGDVATTATGSWSPPTTAARWWSGWSRTATWSRPVSRWSVSTRWEQPDD